MCFYFDIIEIYNKSNITLARCTVCISLVGCVETYHTQAFGTRAIRSHTTNETDTNSQINMHVYIPFISLIYEILKDQ